MDVKPSTTLRKILVDSLRELRRLVDQLAVVEMQTETSPDVYLRLCEQLQDCSDTCEGLSSWIIAYLLAWEIHQEKVRRNL